MIENRRYVLNVFYIQSNLKRNSYSNDMDRIEITVGIQVSFSIRIKYEQYETFSPSFTLHLKTETVGFFQSL